MDINQFWKDILNQDASAIREYFHEDAYVNWHCSNEHFTVEEYIRVNCEYPGSWDGTIERIEQIGNLIITATRVFAKDRSSSFHVVSFIQVIDQKIASVDEYWGDDGEPAEWRLGKNIGTSIRSDYC